MSSNGYAESMRAGGYGPDAILEYLRRLREAQNRGAFGAPMTAPGSTPPPMAPPAAPVAEEPEPGVLNPKGIGPMGGKAAAVKAFADAHAAKAPAPAGEAAEPDLIRKRWAYEDEARKRREALKTQRAGMETYRPSATTGKIDFQAARGGPVYHGEAARTGGFRGPDYEDAIDTFQQTRETAEPWQQPGLVGPDQAYAANAPARSGPVLYGPQDPMGRSSAERFQAADSVLAQEMGVNDPDERAKILRAWYELGKFEI